MKQGIGASSNAGLQRFWQAYYVVNSLALLSYIPVRLMRDSLALQQKDQYVGVSRETEIIVTFLVFMLTKYRKVS